MAQMVDQRRQKNARCKDAMKKTDFNSREHKILANSSFNRHPLIIKIHMLAD